MEGDVFTQKENMQHRSSTTSVGIQVLCEYIRTTGGLNSGPINSTTPSFSRFQEKKKASHILLPQAELV